MKVFKIYIIIVLYALLSRNCFSEPWEGNGSSTSPFLIQDIYQLEGLADSVNAGNRYEGIYFEQTNDIDISKSQIRQNNWVAIGTLKNEFAGIYDGKDNYIINANYSGQSYAGIFGHVGRNGTVKNLTVSQSNGYAHAWMGGVCGLNEGNIYNCHTKNGEISCYKIIGGVVGANFGIVKECSNGFYIISSTATGGIVGYNYGEILYCYNNYSFDGALGTGGIAGYNGGFNQETYCIDDIRLGYIQNCYNLSDVKGESYTGGICGRNDGYILNCHNDAGIYGIFYTGGITGTNGNKNNVNSYILNSYNIGEVNSSEDIAGGISGENEKNGFIQNVYNGNNVTIKNVYENSNIVCINYGQISFNYWLDNGKNNIKEEYGYTISSSCYIEDKYKFLCNPINSEITTLYQALNSWTDTTTVKNISNWNDQDQFTDSYKNILLYNQKKLTIYTDNQNITHIFPNEEHHIRICDILGIIFFNKEIISKEEITIKLPSGIYIINNQKYKIP